jgi:hypothetical protein
VVAALDSRNDLYRFPRVNYLNNAGDALCRAAEEAQREQPREEIIDHFLRSAAFHQQAVAALDNINDPERSDRARYLDDAGTALYYAAEEAGREQPRKKALDRLLEAAVLHQQAVAALNNTNDPNRIKRAERLNDTGKCFLHLAGRLKGNHQIKK